MLYLCPTKDVSDHFWFSLEGSPPNSQQPPPPEAAGLVDGAIDLSTNPDGNRHEIFSAERKDRKLLSYETTTGVNQRMLIINPNVLSQGFQYFIQLTVLSRGSVSIHHQPNSVFFI